MSQPPAKRPPRTPAGGRRAQIDEIDRRLLEFLAEHRAVVVPQIERLLGVTRPAAERRVRSLAEHGHLASEPIFAGQPAAVWITRRGLGAIERRLPAARPDLRGYRHDVGVAWLWLAARDGVFGQVTALQSERELRSHDRNPDREGRPLGVGIGGVGPRGGERLHYPDLVLETPRGHRVALELELTPKSTHRLNQIMRGYAFDPRTDAVLYLVPDRAMLRKIEDASRRAGISDMVQIQLLARGSPAGAPDTGRAADRQARRAAAKAPSGRER